MNDDELRMRYIDLSIGVKSEMHKELVLRGLDTC